MIKTVKTVIRKIFKAGLVKLAPELGFILNTDSEKILWSELLNYSFECQISEKSRLYSPYHLDQTIVGDYSYVARNSRISMTHIGQFCSIGINFVCGRGIHPLNGISTSPFFYSEKKQNGFSISTNNKFNEREWITIGNDVFIGMNVIILDGVHIGDGAVIGAGAVVSKDIPPYAIAVGCPVRVIGYRFNEQVVEDLLSIKWWDRGEDHLKKIEELFFDIEKYLCSMKQQSSEE